MKSIIHTIKAYLYKYKLSKNPDEYTAVPIPYRTLDTKTICELAVKRGGANIQATAMRYAVELFLKEMEYNLCDGYSVNTGSFIATPVIKGLFHSPKETFNPTKHTLLFHFKQGKSLRKKSATVEVEITGVGRHQMQIATVTDIRSGSINGIISPHHTISIQGKYLKLVGDHPDVGVSFINMATNARIKVDKSDVVDNRKSTIIIITPALEAGSYRLEVTTMFTTSGTLKQPRTATHAYLLRVI